MRLISFWLKEPPAKDWEGFSYQVAEAEWLEKRYFKNLGSVLGGK